MTKSGNLFIVVVNAISKGWCYNANIQCLQNTIGQRLGYKIKTTIEHSNETYNTFQYHIYDQERMDLNLTETLDATLGPNHDQNRNIFKFLKLTNLIDKT